CRYVCDILALSPLVLSPKSQRYVSASPSGSEDCEPSTLMTPVAVLYGPPATATGGWFGGGGGGGTGGDGGVTPLVQAAPTTQKSTRYEKRDITTVSRGRFQTLNQ